MKTYKNCTIMSLVTFLVCICIIFQARLEPIFSFALKYIVSGQHPLQGIAVEVITR